MPSSRPPEPAPTTASPRPGFATTKIWIIYAVASSGERLALTAYKDRKDAIGHLKLCYAPVQYAADMPKISAADLLGVQLVIGSLEVYRPRKETKESIDGDPDQRTQG